MSIIMPAGSRNGEIYAHEMVAKVAKEFANEVYEGLVSKDNEFYKANQNRKMWVKRNAHLFIDMARGVLAEMLSRDDIGQDMKDDIYDALIADKTIPRSGTSVGAYH